MESEKAEERKGENEVYIKEEVLDEDQIPSRNSEEVYVQQEIEDQREEQYCDLEAKNVAIIKEEDKFGIKQEPELILESDPLTASTSDPVPVAQDVSSSTPGVVAFPTEAGTQIVTSNTPSPVAISPGVTTQAVPKICGNVVAIRTIDGSIQLHKIAGGEVKQVCSTTDSKIIVVPAADGSNKLYTVSDGKIGEVTVNSAPSNVVAVPSADSLSKLYSVADGSINNLVNATSTLLAVPNRDGSTKFFTASDTAVTNYIPKNPSSRVALVPSKYGKTQIFALGEGNEVVPTNNQVIAVPSPTKLHTVGFKKLIPKPSVLSNNTPQIIPNKRQILPNNLQVITNNTQVIPNNPHVTSVTTGTTQLRTLENQVQSVVPLGELQRVIAIPAANGAARLYRIAPKRHLPTRNLRPLAPAVEPRRDSGYELTPITGPVQVTKVPSLAEITKRPVADRAEFGYLTNHRPVAGSVSTISRPTEINCSPFVAESDDEPPSRKACKSLEFSLPSDSFLKNKVTRKTGKTIRREERTVVSCVVKSCDEDKARNKLHIPLDRPTERAAYYCGVSTATIQSIRNQMTNTSTTEESISEAQKKTTEDQSKVVETHIFDVFDLNLIKNCVSEYYILHKDVPSYLNLLPLIRSKMNFPGDRRTLTDIFQKIGYVWKKTKKQRKLLIERREIIHLKTKFIKEIRKYRSENRPIFYLDEAWVDDKLTCEKYWRDTTKLEPDENQEVNRLIIGVVGSKNGFLPDSIFMYPSNTSTAQSYSEAMNSNVFEMWLKQIMVKLPSNSVLVIDRAPYHMMQESLIPSRYATKQLMRKWLKRRKIPYTEDLRKFQLMDLIKENSSQSKVYRADKILSEGGHTVLRLPPYSCELNPVEFIWSKIRIHLAEHVNKVQQLNLIQIQYILNNILEEIQAPDWSGYIDGVIQIEDEYWSKSERTEMEIETILSNSGDTFVESDEENDENDDDPGSADEMESEDEEDETCSFVKTENAGDEEFFV